jgi:hypothetical protein
VHYTKLRQQLAETERVLAARRDRAHGELANAIVGLGNVIPAEQLSYKSFQRGFGRSVKVRSPGAFVQRLRLRAESAGGRFVQLPTRTLRLSQFDHCTATYQRKTLSERWHVLGDGSGVVQRDVYFAFLAQCVQSHARAGDAVHPLCCRGLGRQRTCCWDARGGCAENVQASRGFSGLRRGCRRRSAACVEGGQPRVTAVRQLRAETPGETLPESSDFSQGRSQCADGAMSVGSWPTVRVGAGPNWHSC